MLEKRILEYTSKSKKEETIARGKVVSIHKRNNSIQDQVFLNIEGEEVEFPFTENGLSLLPLQLSLIGREVSYVRKYSHWFYTDKDFGSSSDYQLELLDGPLKGSIYTG